MTPLQARAFVRLCRISLLRAASSLEYYELLAERLQELLPGMNPVAEATRQRTAAGKARQQAGHVCDVILQWVDRDEEANGWKGPDRDVEVLPD